MSFEESMKRLDEIVEMLSKNEMPLDESIRLFDEGLALVRDCDTKLKDFETQIAEIMRRNGEQDGNSSL